MAYVASDARWHRIKAPGIKWEADNSIYSYVLFSPSSVLSYSPIAFPNLKWEPRGIPPKHFRFMRISTGEFWPFGEKEKRLLLILLFLASRHYRRWRRSRRQATAVTYFTGLDSYHGNLFYELAISNIQAYRLAVSGHPHMFGNKFWGLGCHCREKVHKCIGAISDAAPLILGAI